jgi:hypothetical protein
MLFCHPAFLSEAGAYGACEVAAQVWRQVEEPRRARPAPYDPSSSRAGASRRLAQQTGGSPDPTATTPAARVDPIKKHHAHKPSGAAPIRVDTTLPPPGPTKETNSALPPPPDKTTAPRVVDPANPRTGDPAAPGSATDLQAPPAPAPDKPRSQLKGRTKNQARAARRDPASAAAAAPPPPDLNRSPWGNDPVGVKSQ